MVCLGGGFLIVLQKILATTPDYLWPIKIPTCALMHIQAFSIYPSHKTIYSLSQKKKLYSIWAPVKSSALHIALVTDIVV